MKEGFNQIDRNPFRPAGGLFHVHTHTSEEQNVDGEIQRGFKIDTTEAGKAFISGLKSDDKQFTYQGVRYQILSDQGYLSFNDENDEGHKHYGFGQEAVNFYVRRLD